MADSKIIDMIVKASTKNAVGSMKDMEDVTKATKSEIVSMITFLGRLGKQLYKTTDASDEYNTSVRLLNTTLGEASKEANTFISKLSEMSGINTIVLNKSVAKFSQMAESLNFTNQEAERFSENLSILTTKLAMLYNTDYTTMANTVMKAVQGAQVTLFSRTGIKLNEFSEQATLSAHGIDRTVDSLNEAELSLVRYATILRQVTSDNREYQQAVNSLAWQKQILASQVKNLASAVGQVLTPAFTTLITVLNGVIMAIIEIVKLIGSLIGVNVNLSSSTSSAADSYNKLGSSIGGASKEAKKSLRAFDKLNNITTPSAGGGGGGSALGIDKSILGLLDSVSDGFLDIRNKATEIRDKILEWLGFQKYIDLITGETKYKFLGFATTIKNIWKWWKNLNTVAKIFVGLGIYVLLSKIVTTGLKAAKSLLGIGTAFSRINTALAGIVMVGGGLAMFLSALTKIKEEGSSVSTAIEEIAGSLLIAGRCNYNSNSVGWCN